MTLEDVDNEPIRHSVYNNEKWCLIGISLICNEYVADHDVEKKVTWSSNDVVGSFVPPVMTFVVVYIDVQLPQNIWYFPKLGK